MDIRKQPGFRLLRLERGSAIVEGLVALMLAFVLLVLIVQAVAFVATRSAVGAAAGAFANHAAVTGAEESELVAVLEGGVPGIERADVQVDHSAGVVAVEVQYSWRPPGPAMGAITVRINTSAPVISRP